MEPFEQIYSSYLKDVYKYVLSLCRDPVEAEEIAQETFYQALKAMPSFRGDCKLIVWLCQIAKHIYFARLKKGKRTEARPPDELYSTVSSSCPPKSVEQQLLEEADAMAVHRHLHELEEPYKEVFMLRVFGELSFQKIGDIFGRTESWARTTYHRAKVRLIDKMEEEG